MRASLQGYADSEACMSIVLVSASWLRIDSDGLVEERRMTALGSVSSTGITDRTAEAQPQVGSSPSSSM